MGSASNKAICPPSWSACSTARTIWKAMAPKATSSWAARVSSARPRHYAYLKIAEGCNNRCHYCAIPLIRGPLRSRDMADCVAEARWLAGEGVKELIVVAQDPTAYGEDWGKPGSICELLDKLNKVPGHRLDPHACTPTRSASPMNLSPP